MFPGDVITIRGEETTHVYVWSSDDGGHRACVIAEIIDVLYQGEVCLVLVPSGELSMVFTPHGKVGWVSTRFTRLAFSP